MVVRGHIVEDWPVAFDRAVAVAGARRILSHRGWCVYEACVDVPAQVWEARALIFDITAVSVADSLEGEIELEPEHDGRITGCDRCTLEPDPSMGAFLFYVSDSPVLDLSAA